MAEIQAAAPRPQQSPQIPSNTLGALNSNLVQEVTRLFPLPNFRDLAACQYRKLCT